MKVLIVEDFAPLRDSLQQGLREAGYAVDACADGEVGLWHAQQGSYDVIILDLMLPKRDGLSVLKQLRKSGCQACVLILTAKDKSQDKVSGLDLGADDYLVKPFDFPELLARVSALIRRKYEMKSSVLQIADMEIDLTKRIVRRAGQLIDLSGREYALLEYMAMNLGRTVSREDIWQHIYDFNAEIESNVVDVFVGLVRKKIEREGSPKLIHTRRGQGYCMDAAGGVE